MPILAYILTALAAYLLGSIPTGYLVAKARGIDIRNAGSGNIGATNAMRVLGKPMGILVLLFDAFKGYGAVMLLVACSNSLPSSFSKPFIDEILNKGWPPVICIIAGIAAVLGHNFTCWLRFKGGKGIATTAGAYFGLAPLAVSFALAAWLILFVTTRYVSVASLAAAIALPTAVWLTEDSVLLCIVTTALGLLAIYKHKGNIQRLVAGTENRVNFKKEKSAA